MPRRSLRAKNSEANNGSKLDGAKTSQQKSDLLGEQTLESFYNPNEMKRQIADALKEPKNKAKREKNRANNNAKNGEGKRSKKVLVLSDEKEVKKMDYADAVRNTLSPRGNKEVTAEIVVESKSLKTPLTEEEKSICDNICSDINSNTNLSNCSFSKEAVCDLLKDAEIIEELEDSTWEVVSTGDCSINEDEDPFHLVASDEVMTTSSTNEADKENRNLKEQNNNNNVEMKAQGEPKTEPTSRKKIVVSRKYIGGPDLPEKLIKLGFQAMVGCQQQVEEDEDEKKPAEHWSGLYRGTMFEVEAKRRCGLLVTSVRAKSESLLLGLNCLQGLIDDTGLLSYANFNVPTLTQEKARVAA